MIDQLGNGERVVRVWRIYRSESSNEWKHGIDCKSKTMEWRKVAEESFIMFDMHDI